VEIVSWVADAGLLSKFADAVDPQLHTGNTAGSLPVSTPPFDCLP